MDLLHAKAESSHAVEDLIRSLYPFERRAALVVGDDVRQDGRAQLRNARMRSTFQRLLGEQAEEALHEPRGVGRREMKLHTRMAQQPSLHGRRLVCGPIVAHDVTVQRTLYAG